MIIDSGADSDLDFSKTLDLTSAYPVYIRSSGFLSPLPRFRLYLLLTAVFHVGRYDTKF